MNRRSLHSSAGAFIKGSQILCLCILHILTVNKEKPTSCLYGIFYHGRRHKGCSFPTTFAHSSYSFALCVRTARGPTADHLTACGQLLHLQPLHGKVKLQDAWSQQAARWRCFIEERGRQLWPSRTPEPESTPGERNRSDIDSIWRGGWAYGERWRRSSRQNYYYFLHSGERCRLVIRALIDLFHCSHVGRSRVITCVLLNKCLFRSIRDLLITPVFTCDFMLLWLLGGKWCISNELALLLWITDKYAR